jgi:hypothetical protein
VKKSCHPQRSLITVQNLPLKLCMFQVQAFLFIQIISRCFFSFLVKWHLINNIGRKCYVEQNLNWMFSMISLYLDMWFKYDSYSFHKLFIRFIYLCNLSIVAFFFVWTGWWSEQGLPFGTSADKASLCCWWRQFRIQQRRKLRYKQ